MTNGAKKFITAYPAQYASEEGIPQRKWSNAQTKLKDLDASQLHYVRVPANHIVIDFDIPDENGNLFQGSHLQMV